MPEPLIVVAGENLIDRVVAGDGRPVDLPGGGPFNTARALARLGCRVAYLGRISTDEPGRRLRALLDADGVDLSLVVSTDDPTLIAHATLDAQGQATYRFEWERSAAAGLRPQDVPPSLPAETVALHVGTLGLLFEPIASTISGVVDRVAPDVLVMVDPNVRPAAIGDEPAYRDRLRRVLARADVLKASVDDLRWLRPLVPPVDAARDLLGDARAIVLITDGPRPVRVVGSWPEPFAIDVPQVRVVDTIGAGDAFGAGVLADWVRRGRTRMDLDDPTAILEATRFGIGVASWTVGRAGADPPRWLDLRTGETPMR